MVVALFLCSCTFVEHVVTDLQDRSKVLIQAKNPYKVTCHNLNPGNRINRVSVCRQGNTVQINYLPVWKHKFNLLQLVSEFKTYLRGKLLEHDLASNILAGANVELWYLLPSFEPGGIKLLFQVKGPSHKLGVILPIKFDLWNQFDAKLFSFATRGYPYEPIYELGSLRVTWAQNRIQRFRYAHLDGYPIFRSRYGRFPQFKIKVPLFSEIDMTQKLLNDNRFNQYLSNVAPVYIHRPVAKLIYAQSFPL